MCASGILLWWLCQGINWASPPANTVFSILVLYQIVLTTLGFWFFFLHRLGSPLGTINGNKYLMNEWNDEDVRRCWLDCPQHLHGVVWQVWSFFLNLFILISWRLITSQYCSGFCHTLTWISHGFTCIPHPDPPSHLPLYPIPLGLPSAPGLSTCLMHPTWAGDLFHYR